MNLFECFPAWVQVHECKYLESIIEKTKIVDTKKIIKKYIRLQESNELLLLWKLLNVITLGQKETDYFINHRSKSPSQYFIVSFLELVLSG